VVEGTISFAFLIMSVECNTINYPVVTKLKEAVLLKARYQKMFGSELPVRQILFNLITSVALAGGIISLAVSVATGLPVIQDIVVVITILLLIFCIYITNAKGKLQLASAIVILFISMVLLPLMFFTGGGVYSGMPSWFVLGMVFTFLLVEGRICWLFLAMQVIVYAGCIVLATLYPPLVRMFPTPEGEVIDIAQSMFIAAFTIGFILRFQTGIYEKILKKVTEQSRQLEEARDAANRANSAKTQFLSHMSHDIRTPINGIIGMLEIADENPDDKERQAECRKKIRIASNHLLSLINDVLDISMLESGKVELTDEVFDIRRLTEDCLSIVQGKAAEKSVSVTAKYTDIRHPCLYGSPLHVRQIILNIVGNAVKYNKENGSVEVELKELYCEKETAGMELKVSDTGIGISEEFLKNIYEPFTQAENGARTKYEGTGLGMTIVKSLIDSMGGRIDIKSSLGVGSEFTVIIPFRVSEQQETGLKEVPDDQADISGMHVLLVEDNDLNREISQYVLEKAGARVVNAVNGSEAVKIFTENGPGTFDCILMDIMMPVMDGYEATRKIRSMPRADGALIPIIAMTANAYTDDVRKAKEAGMNMHIPKPVDAKKLFRIMASFHRKDKQ